MKASYKHLALYFVTMATALLLLFLIFRMGPEAPALRMASSEIPWWHMLREEFFRNLDAPITGLILQVFAILAFSRMCASLLKALGQPQVVGEMIAGILLGKSVLGTLWPGAFSALFPESSMPRLFFLSQIGLLFFLFVVGLNLKITELKKRAAAALWISHVSIVVPFLLGALLSLAIYEKYGPADFSFTSFALFLGVAMSITAFPVLARILQEKQLTGTPLGTMALTCAAIDDVTAWCLLAAVIGIVKAGSGATAFVILLASILYVLVLWKVVRPLLEKVLRPAAADGRLTRSQLALVFGVVLGSALVTELIGIHAFFGAFMAGVVMPQSASLRATLVDKTEEFSAVVLLPIFFAYTGIRMELGFLHSPEEWLVCVATIFCATFGKLVGSACAARYSGMNWRESLALGSLMNTRGLMELVVLNVGYDLGILSPTLFAIFVIMAVVTTTMTAPLLALFAFERKKTPRSATLG